MIVTCRNCRIHLGADTSIRPESRQPYPGCGSMLRSIHVTPIHDMLPRFREKLSVKGRHTGGKKPFIEQVHADDLHRDTGTWRHLSRVIDRGNDLYWEVVRDQATGEVVHECREPLSEHRDHGAAKRQEETNKGEPAAAPDRDKTPAR